MKEVNEMDIKEMVDKINGMPTVLVKVNLGDTDKHDIVVAKPAIYHEGGYATIYRYIGPRDWKEWAEVRDDNRDGEKVNKSTLTGPIADSPIIRGAVVNSVTPYETDLDTMPLRELPLWAKELWVKHRETLFPDGYGEMKMNARMMAQMKELIDRERGAGGLNPDRMSTEMQERYLKLWYSIDVMDRAIGKGLTADSLRTVWSNLRTISDIVPRIRELPWRNEEDLDPESWFDREDVFESMTDIVHGTMGSLLKLIWEMIADREDEGGSKDG